MHHRSHNQGVSVQGRLVSVQGVTVTVEEVSVQEGLYPGGDLCPGGWSLSRRGVAVQEGALCPGDSIWGVSVQGFLSRGWSLSREGDLCQGRGSLSRGSLSRGVSV